MQTFQTVKRCHRPYQSTLTEENESCHKRVENQRKEIRRLHNHIGSLEQSKNSWKEKAKRLGKQVKDLIENNERLKAEKEVLEITEKDLRFRNNELHKCNEGLAKNIEELEIEGDKVREAYALYEETTGLKQVKVDTIQKMQERLKEVFCSDSENIRNTDGYIRYVIDKIVKEMLEEDEGK